MLWVCNLVNIFYGILMHMFVYVALADGVWFGLRTSRTQKEEKSLQLSHFHINLLRSKSGEIRLQLRQDPALWPHLWGCGMKRNR